MNTLSRQGERLLIGDTRWYVRSEVRPLLFGAEGLRLQEWLQRGEAFPVKVAAHRTIYRVTLPEIQFYLKHYPIADPRAWMRGWLRPSKARAESDLAAAVASHDIPTVTALAFGERSGRIGPAESYLITRTLHDVVPLGTFLENLVQEDLSDRPHKLRQRLSAGLGTFLARLHDRGITHHDLHPGNILLRMDQHLNPNFFLIDLHAVSLGGPLGWRASRKNLILLNRWSILRTHRSDRMRFWRAYTQARSAWQTDPAAARDLARELEARTELSNLVFWDRRDKRCLATNRYYRRIRLPQVGGHVLADLPHEAYASLLQDPDEPFRRTGIHTIKDSRSSTVVEMTLKLPAGERPVIYKRFRITSGWDPLKSLFRRSPALRSWIWGHGLRERLLPTPRPLAVLHRRRHGLRHEGYLLMEKLEHAVDLRAFVNGMEESDSADRQTALRQLINAVAGLVRRLHERGLGHRDLKAANILVQSLPVDQQGDLSGPKQVQPHLIDLVGIRRLGTQNERQRRQNLARLNASFAIHPLLTRSDRLRFLRAYLQWGLRGKEDWKSWWSDVEEGTRRKIERNRNRGRPLA